MGIGTGVVRTVGARLALALEVHVVIATPYPVVRFIDWEVAKVARPAVWTTLALLSWL